MLLSPKASIKEGQDKVPSGSHPTEKQPVAGCFAMIPASNNDTPVLPEGGRLREILAGVRVPWSGEASRRPSLRPDIWGSSVEYRCERDLCRVSMSEAPGIATVKQR